MKAFKYIIIFIVLVLLFAILVTEYSNSHKENISIAVADANGSYYAHALKYKELLKKEGVDVEIKITQGSIDTIDKLLKKKVDFGFIQGGTEKNAEGLFSLANVAYEPIWVFYKDQNISSLGDLLGKKIAVGRKKSGIYPIAKSLLLANKIDKDNTQFTNPPSQEAFTQLKNKSIDAMFYVASFDAKLVQNLLENPDISLLDFNKAQSYKQYFLKNSENYHIVKLNASGFNIEQNIPKKDHTLLAKKTILVTLDATDEMSRLLLKTAWKVHKYPGVFHDEDTFPNDKVLVLKQHPASIRFFKEKEHYYEKKYNFWVAQSLDAIHNFAVHYFLPIVLIFAFFVEVIFPTINWYTRRKIITWYDEINKLDTKIEELTLEDAKSRKKQLEKIQQTVRDIDDIPSVHMTEFYSLQNQITNISNDIEKRILKLQN